MTEPPSAPDPHDAPAGGRDTVVVVLGGGRRVVRSGEVRPDDAETVERLLGRRPQGGFSVVVRDAADGAPVVIRNAPLLDDGTPMPTSYWLVDPDLVRRVGTLEAAGGVRRAEAEVDAGELAAAHERHAAARDAELDRLRPATAAGTAPRPSGGVGGTRQGVKCLHAHYGWWLAGGDDPVGAWVETQLWPVATGPDPAG